MSRNMLIHWGTVTLASFEIRSGFGAPTGCAVCARAKLGIAVAPKNAITRAVARTLLRDSHMFNLLLPISSPKVAAVKSGAPCH